MSGLCGWIGGVLEADTAAHRIQAMADALLPPGTHGEFGYELDTHAGAALQTRGQRTDLARDGRGLAVIEGFWHWDDQPLAAEAKHRGTAASLLRRFRERGPEIVRRLHGSFALAILDPDRNEALLAVDRIGTRPLAYAFSPAGLVFGSTLDALRAHPDIQPALSLQGVFDYLYFNMVPSPGTVYSGLHKLEPAQYLHYRAGRSETRTYWLPSFTDDRDADFNTLAHALRDTLARAVRRADPEQAAGAFLSGGLDSSTVSGMLARVRGARPRTYSIGFDVPGYDEIEYARIAARHFDTEAHEYYVKPQDIAEAAQLIGRIYDEPFGNSSALPVHCCVQLAKSDGVGVLLAGDGGDEIFAGNARYAKQMLFEQYSRLPSGLRRGLIEPALGALPAAITPIRKLQRYVEQARVPLPDRLETYNLLHMVPLGEIFEPDFLAAINPERPLELLREVYRRTDTEHPVDRMLYLDWKFTLADNDLRKVNRMAQYAGIEVRYPMLDDELIELSTRVPAGLKLRGQQLRYFYKRALRDFLPREIITKRKHGFGLPFGEWLRASAPLQQIVDDSLHGLQRRGWLKAAFIERVVTDHRTGHAGFYGTMLWVLTMLELWLKAHRQ